MEWPARLPPEGGGGVSRMYQSISIGNHACSKLEYIHMKLFKVLNG